MAKRRTTAITTLPATKAKTRFGEVIKRVHNNKEYIIVEKNGIPVIAIMDADEFEDYLEVHNPRIQRLIRKSYEEYKTGKGRQVEEFLAELRAYPKSSVALSGDMAGQSLPLHFPDR